MNTNLPVEYRLSLPSEWDDVVDFANFVFSQAHRPHDFKTLLPKVYADGAPEIALKLLPCGALREHCYEKKRILEREKP